jgi:hypothetical protein
MDILTLIVAVYGALVSSILGIRELQRDRRRINIMLELVPFYERAQITIINIGHRPITITDIAVSDCPRNALFAQGVEEPLPITLGDGEYTTLPLSSVLSEMAFANPSDMHLSVYDAEGNEYNKFKSWEHNPKWGRYRKVTE